MVRSRRSPDTSGVLYPQSTTEADTPPTDDAGEYVCSRRCANGTRCLINVPLPFVSCHQHDQSNPIIDE